MEMEMDIVIIALVGALIGWAASLLMRTNVKRGLIENIVVGVIGAVLASWLFGGVLHIGGAKTAGSLHIVGLLWGVLGAGVFIAALRFLRVMR